MRYSTSVNTLIRYSTHPTISLVTATWLCICSCTESHESDGGIAENEADAAAAGDGGGAGPVKADRVDLLFVIDNSRSMKAEQAKLRYALPRMLRILLSGDLHPEDSGGEPENGKDFPAVESLHLAVVSTYMGTPGVRMITDPESKCNYEFGDDASS